MNNRDDQIHGTVIVTGAAAGVGRGCYEFLAGRGTVNVLGVDCDASGLAELEVSEHARVFEGDVGDPGTPAKVVQTAKVGFGTPIVGLVNNAAMLQRGDAIETTLELWERQLSVNLRGPWLMCQAVLPEMLDNGRGSIVNVVSIEGNHSGARNLSYAVSKAGLLQLTRSVALDFGARGIRCNAVSPGSIDTPMMRQHLASYDRPEEFRRKTLAKNPLNRMGTPLEVARAIWFLLNEVDSFINGADLVVDGGRSVTT